MQNKFLAFLMVGMLSGLLISCNKPSEDTAGEEIHEEHTGRDTDMKSTEMDMDSAQDDVIVSSADFQNLSDKVAQGVTQYYLELKDALVASNTLKSQEAASKMLDVLEANENGDAISSIEQNARFIATSDEIDSIRSHFDNISENVYLMAKNKDTGVTLYKQYCPMAFNNQGAFWLSSNEEIRNPYFGDKMLKCGKVQETIGNKVN